MKKLFAVGTTDSNPENWEPWDEVELYVAEDAEEALKMAGYCKTGPVVEVDMSVSRLVMRASTYIED